MTKKILQSAIINKCSLYKIINKIHGKKSFEAKNHKFQNTKALELQYFK